MSVVHVTVSLIQYSNWSVMELKIVLSIIFVLLSQISAHYDISDFAVHKECEELYTETEPRIVPYEEQYQTRNWLGGYVWKTRTNYRYENRTSWHKRPACCSNHTEFGDHGDLCIPKCEKSCGSKGICAEPDICKCDSGYEYNHSLEDCEPVCSDECVNGVCTSPNECTCHNGYHMQPNGYHCTPTCETCSNLEYCSEPHICKCLIGYNRTSMERVDTAPEEVCNPVCERECVNSDCVEPNLCKCHPGYVDEDDDIFTCEPKCTQGCTNGECTAPETCVCATGYETKGNVTHICNPICSPECINGVCSAPDVCSCSDGYQLGEKNTCEPICNNPCINAKCTAPNECTCIDGYVKRDSSDVNSTCIVKCECEHGFCKDTDSVCDSCADGYELFSRNNSTECRAHCDHACVNGQCVEPQKCACNDFYVPVNNKDLGNSLCVHACGGQCAHGVCNLESRSCSCHHGWDGKLCDEGLSRERSVQGVIAEEDLCAWWIHEGLERQFFDEKASLDKEAVWLA
ncbi:hypothetical protein QAD02_018238 [Eretmocerus hayati]|uniref:Uncharacterized protein n=1 Tax=Eretmocerus hayati TaxID=131215 RepID=A0ACC2PG43_9HYME|nr:hypothetical protein QAD02_018238 [Eretmocerus hayati]